MKINISYRHVESPQAVESALDRHVSKMAKLLRSIPIGLNLFFPRTSHCPRAPYMPRAWVPTPQAAREKLLLSSRRRSKSVSLACVRIPNGSASAGKPSERSPKKLFCTVRIACKKRPDKVKKLSAGAAPTPNRCRNLFPGLNAPRYFSSVERSKASLSAV